MTTNDHAEIPMNAITSHAEEEITELWQLATDSVSLPPEVEGASPRECSRLKSLDYLVVQGAKTNHMVELLLENQAEFDARYEEQREYFRNAVGGVGNNLSAQMGVHAENNKRMQWYTLGVAALGAILGGIALVNSYSPSPERSRDIKTSRPVRPHQVRNEEEMQEARDLLMEAADQMVTTTDILLDVLEKRESPAPVYVQQQPQYPQPQYVQPTYYPQQAYVAPPAAPQPAPQPAPPTQVS